MNSEAFFEWDPQKASVNVALHGISFEEAATIFDDEWALTVEDFAHSQWEPREFTIGRSHRNRLVAVAHTRRGERIRIISARLATPREQRQYMTDTE